MRKRIYILVSILGLFIFDIISYSVFQVDILTAMAPVSHKGTYYIFVELDQFVMYLYKEGEIIKTYPVSGGTYATPSPLGTWTIVSKANWGEGFGGTWMGFNVPWGKYGIHGTDEPWSIGNPLSKGCIRMFNKDAEEIKKIVPVGTKITIVKGPYGPFGEGFRTLKPGDIGSDVYAVQEKMKELGFYPYWVDGVYGDGMQKEVARFQKSKGLAVSKYITEPFYEALGITLFE